MKDVNQIFYINKKSIQFALWAPWRALLAHGGELLLVYDIKEHIPNSAQSVLRGQRHFGYYHGRKVSVLTLWDPSLGSAARELHVKCKKQLSICQRLFSRSKRWWKVPYTDYRGRNKHCFVREKHILPLIQRDRENLCPGHGKLAQVSEIHGWFQARAYGWVSPCKECVGQDFKPLSVELFESLQPENKMQLLTLMAAELAKLHEKEIAHRALRMHSFEVSVGTHVEVRIKTAAQSQVFRKIKSDYFQGRPTLEYNPLTNEWQPKEHMRPYKDVHVASVDVFVLAGIFYKLCSGGKRLSTHPQPCPDKDEQPLAYLIWCMRYIDPLQRIPAREAANYLLLLTADQLREKCQHQ